MSRGMSDRGMSDQELRDALHRLAPDVKENGVWESLHGEDAAGPSRAPGPAGRREGIGRKSVGRRPPTVGRPSQTRTRRLLSLGAAVVVVLVALGFGVNALVQHLRQDEQVLVISDQPMQPGSGANEPTQPVSDADALADRLQELIAALPTPYPADDVRYASSNPYDYLEDNPAFDEIVAMGYDALPGLDRHLATTATAGLGDYLVCAAIESITRCDLKQVEGFAWADSRTFWGRWNQYLKRMPTLVDEILERDPSFWIQGEEIVKLGAPAVPYVVEYADRIDEQQDSGIPVLLRIPALLSTLVPGSEQAATVAEFKARNAEVIDQLKSYVEDRSVEVSGDTWSTSDSITTTFTVEIAPEFVQFSGLVEHLVAQGVAVAELREMPFAEEYGTGVEVVLRSEATGPRWAPEDVLATHLVFRAAVLEKMARTDIDAVGVAFVGQGEVESQSVVPIDKTIDPDWYATPGLTLEEAAQRATTEISAGLASSPFDLVELTVIQEPDGTRVLRARLTVAGVPEANESIDDLNVVGAVVGALNDEHQAKIGVVRTEVSATDGEPVKWSIGDLQLKSSTWWQAEGITEGTYPRPASLSEAPLSPEACVLTQVEAINNHDWPLAYSLYASTPLEYGDWLKEHVEADEVYEDFAVHGTEFLSETLLGKTVALVRVTYKVHFTLPGGQRTVVEVAEPGEDWSVEKVDGLWRVRWLPRQ